MIRLERLFRISTTAKRSHARLRQESSLLPKEIERDAQNRFVFRVRGGGAGFGFDDSLLRDFAGRSWGFRRALGRLACEGRSSGSSPDDDGADRGHQGSDNLRIGERESRPNRLGTGSDAEELVNEPRRSIGDEPETEQGAGAISRGRSGARFVPKQRKSGRKVHRRIVKLGGMAQIRAAGFIVHGNRPRKIARTPITTPVQKAADAPDCDSHKRRSRNQIEGRKRWDARHFAPDDQRSDSKKQTAETGHSTLRNVQHFQPVARITFPLLRNPENSRSHDARKKHGDSERTQLIGGDAISGAALGRQPPRHKKPQNEHHAPTVNRKSENFEQDRVHV